MTHRLLLCASTLTFLLNACTATPTVPAEPTWDVIFDGTTLTGWTPKISGQPLGEDAEELFQIRDGALVVDYPDGTSFNGAFGHLFYDAPMSHYRLRFEYQFFGNQAEGGPDWAYMNSGVMVHAQAPQTMDTNQGFPVSVEAQLLGAGDHASDRTTANVCSPGTDIVIDGALVKHHCINSDTAAAGPDEWVRFEIHVQGGEMMRLQIDGEDAFLLTNPTYDTDDGSVAQNGWSGPLSAGYIALQAESHPVAFRNIELMRLASAETDD